MIAPAGIRKISDPLESLAMEFSEGCLTADEKKGRGWASLCTMRMSETDGISQLYR